jgi:hypothetical protein
MNSCPLYTGLDCRHYSLNGEDETALYRIDSYIFCICYIQVPFKAGLTIYGVLSSFILKFI